MKVLLSIIFSFFVVVAQAATIKGRVTSADDGQPIPGASITIMERPNEGTEADDDGYYSLSLPSGQYNIMCEVVGFDLRQKAVNLKNSATVNFALVEETEYIDGVEVSSKVMHNTVEQTQMGVAFLEVEDLKKMPSMFGEQDIIKSLQLMPGVKAESEASSGFQVRGGESSQNLVLLDGATVNNAGHLMGLFSTFNSDVLKDVTLYKGQMPAQFGGRIASVLDVNTINGNDRTFQADGAIGLLASKLTLQGPIQPGKSSWLIAGRRTYADLFLKPIEKYRDTKLNFYDLNAKLDFRLTNRDRLDLSFFNGNDNLGLKKLMNMKWGNTIGSAKWRHTYYGGQVLSSNVFYSQYRTSAWMDILDNSYEFKGKNIQLAWNENMRFNIGKRHTLNSGFQSSYFNVVSADMGTSDVEEKEERYAWENHFWVNDEWMVTKRLSLLAGVRLSVFSLLGSGPYYQIDDQGNITSTTNYGKRELVKTYVNPEPRISANYKLTNNQSLKAAYSHTTQNLHTVKNGITSMPIDRYTMSTNLLGPEIADQVSAGYAISFDNETHNNAYEITAEIYYKHTDDVVDYRDGSGAFDYVEIDRLLLAGQGHSYGLELNAKKNFGKLTGWVSYTLCNTETQIDGINNSKWYTANNDRRHDVNIVAMYELSKKWDVSASWKYNSGQAMSLPVGKYEIEGNTIYYYDNRNNYRAPSYHRLDLGATRHGKKREHGESEWAFGLYNAYGRYNPFLIQVTDDKESLTGSKVKQTSLYCFLPSVTYRFKFK